MDQFNGRADAPDAPAASAFAISPADGVPLERATRGIYVGGAGTLAVVMGSGETAIFLGVAGGTVLPLRVREVSATGTTATGLVGLV